MDKLDMILDELQGIKKSLKTISDHQINTSHPLKNDCSVHYNQNVDDTQDKM